MSRKKKILFIGPEQGDHLYNWIRPFLGEFEIHTLTLHPDIPVQGVHHHHMKLFFKNRLDFLFCRWQAQRIVDSVKPDIIHAHYLSSYGILLALLCFKGPKFLSVWGSDVNKSEKSLLMRPLCRWAAKKFDYINSPSEHIKCTLKKWGIKTDLIEVYQYGIETESIEPKSDPNTAPPLKLVSFRDWAPIYRIEYIIESFNRYVTENKKDIELHIFGRRNAEQEQRILKLISECPNQEKIKYYPFTQRESLMKILATMDSFFSVPVMDGMPLSLLEGLYVGLIPILSDIPANREWMENTEVPWIRDYSYSEFCKAIDFLENNRDKFDYQKHREKVKSYADFSKNISRLRSAYLQAPSV